MTYFVNRVKFEDLSTTLRIFKAEEKSKALVLSYFSQEKNRQAVAEKYDSLQPFTVAEALQLSNAEQRMVALRAFDVNTIAQELEAIKLDAQTVKKKHIRWDEHLKPYEVEFEDTYELYKVESEKLGFSYSWMDSSIYFVKCNCPSTDREYYLYVAKEAAINEDAIEAIAWTMRFEGKPLTKAQYLNLMYTET